MYEFPSMEGNRSEEEVLAYLKALGLALVRIEKLPPSKHIFTHKEWHMTGYAVRVDELERMQPKGDLLFVTPDAIERDYPIPSAFAVYMNSVRTTEKGV